MANETADYGFVPIANASGEIRHINCAVAAGYATALFVGDPVKLAGSGDSSGRPTVAVAGDNDANVFGVIVGIDPTGTGQGPDALATKHSLASTADNVIVCPTLPGQLFRVNASGATGARLDDIGLRFNHVTGTGDTLTGRSGYALDMGEDATAGNASANQWALLGFEEDPRNEFSTTVTTDTINVNLVVTCMESFWHTGGAGA